MRFRRHCLLLVLLLSACNPLRPPPLEPPEPPARYPAPPAEGIQLSDRWWRDFDDPQLNQLQQQLFNGNLDLRQGLHRLSQLDAQRRSQAAGRRPTLNLQGNLSRERTPGPAGDSDSSNARLSLAAAYEVDLWNRLRDQEAAATLRLEAGREEVQALLLSLSAQLAEQYFSAVEQRAQLALLDRQEEQQRQLLTLISERYRSGLANAVEVYQARQALAALASRRAPLQTALIRAENAIALLLGRPPGSVSMAEGDLPRLNGEIAIGLPADLLTRRPDLAAALLELKAIDQELAAALAAQLPAVNLSATLGRSLTRLASGDIEGTLWNLAVSLSQPLLDGGRRQAESDRQRARREEQLVVYRKTLLSALQEVDNALRAARNSAEQSERLATERSINEQTLQLATRNYLAGLSDSRDLLDSRLAQLNIRSRQLSNHRQWLIQHISLARALGGSWMEGELERQHNSLAERSPQDQITDGHHHE